MEAKLGRASNVLPDKLHQFTENDRKVLLRFFCGRSSACTTTATACTPVRAALL